jgi:hypothetical protein
MRIPIKPLKQQSEKDCSITSVMMILGYYGIILKSEEIVKNLNKNAEG